MAKLLNPRGYLSPTQVDMWLKSPERYVRQYIHGAAGVRNTGTDFGSKVATAEETGEESDDETINALVALLPTYPSREHTIRVPFETARGWVDLLGKMDKFDPGPLRIRDTKTGVTTWTQAKAAKLIQLRHYAAIVYLEHGRVPSAVHLDWAQTKREEDGSTSLTGRIETFDVTKSLADVLEYLGLVSRVAWEIDARYRDELKKLT